MMMGSDGLKKLLLFIVLFLSDLILSGSVMAMNSATHLHFFKEGEQTIAAFHMKDRPGFKLQSVNGNQVMLVFHDTTRSRDLDRSVSEKEAIEIVENEKTADSIFRIRLMKPVYAIDCSWMETERVFFIRMIPVEGKEETEPAGQGNPCLKGIRFGFKENAARMVMNLEHKPLWEMNYTNPTSVMLLLDAESADIKEKKYGPMRGLRSVMVRNMKDKKTDVSLQLEFPLNRIRTFWMGVGNRLVMDFFDEPETISEEALSVLHNGNNASGDPLFLGEGTDQTEKKEGPFAVSTMENKKHVVRMKIPDKGTLDSHPSSHSLSPGDTPVAQSLPVEPKLDTPFPFSSDITGSIEGLSPEEAFLFGRIQEAMEIHDAEKGTLLVNQFMSQFPGSALSEKMAFWRGDFYYSLWKKGDKKVAPKVTRSYQYAIDRFPRSDYKPLAYIKMAQVSASMGSYFEAVGYMGVLIGQKEENRYLPLAYLTRGKIFLNMGQPERAIKDFKVLLEKYQGTEISVEANLLLASYYHSMGLYEDAEESLRVISDSNPELYLEYPEYLLLSAKNNLYLKNYDLARDYLFKAVNIGHQPEPIDMLLSRIGDTYHNQDNEKEAEKYYRMVIDYYPDTEGASMAKLRLADYFSDITILEDLSNERSNEPIGDLAVLEKAYQLFEMKKYRATMDSLLDLINKTVKTETRKDAKLLYYHAAENEIARLYNSGNDEELITLYLPNKEKFFENIHPDKLLLVAQAFLHNGRYGEAVSTFLGIIPFDLNKKSKGTYYYHLARAYVGNGDTQKALKLLEESKKENLEKYDRQRLTILLADLYREEGLLEKAYGLYGSVVDVKTEIPAREIAEVYLSMGMILNDQGKYEKAKTILNRCLKLVDPDSEQQDLIKSAYMELGQIFHAEGDFKRAVEALERGFKLGYGPDEPDYWENRFKLALSYNGIGEASRAEDLLYEIMEEGNATLQQRAQIKLGAIGLNRQLKQLPLGRDRQIARKNDE